MNIKHLEVKRAYYNDPENVVVEYRLSNGDWCDCDGEPSWSETTPYRIKPRTIRIGELEAQRVPEGWKLVPIEPTDEMIDAGCDAANAFRVDMCRAWDAMLMASPEVGSHD